MQQIQMWTIVGSRDADIARIRSWFQSLQTYLSSIEISALDDGDISVAARARSIVRQVKKRQGSIIDRLLQLENKEVVSRLNSQQQANWLNSVKDDKGGRALAKRAQKAQGGEIDYTDQAQTAVAKIATSVLSVNPPNDTCSFYSLSDCRQSTVVAARELVLLVDGLTVTDVLPVIGLNGIPFEAHAGNYVDPFSLRIRRGKLFMGQILNEADVWVRRIQGGVSNFPCPGRPDSNITGVIAIRDLDPDAYALMTSKDIRPYFEMQCSVQLRGALAVVPQDPIALNVAAVWNILETFGENGNLTTLEKSTLESLVGNLRFLVGHADTFTEIYTSIQLNADVRPWFSGDRNISNILKVVVSLLCYYPFQPVETLPGVLRALYYLESYQAVKRTFKDADSPDARSNALKLLLGIDFNRNATKLLPLFEVEPENPQHYDTVDIQHLVIPNSVPHTRGLIGLSTYLKNQQELGTSPVLLRAVAAVQSLECAGESDRIDTAKRTSLLPDPISDVDSLNYIRGVMRRIYSEDYQRRLREKHQQEEQITLQRQVAELIAAPDYGMFRKLLLASVVTNRDNKGFTMLMETLCTINNVNIPARLEKLSLLMTGRDIDAPEIPVWANGNFLLNWDKVGMIFDAAAASADTEAGIRSARQMMVEMRAMRKKYGLHTYTHTNRHHHDNDFPSYWAMGFKDLSHMKREVSAAEFNRYIDQHCLSKKCCMPNDNERKDFGL